ncbi:Uncharacterized protein SCF082_LOCUS52108 [Durusdinium trenchii]|uniref:Uncharacterized protein n=1 Tax=Durusdinium trenchii TaxID=1381693 RepID=A0ABP0SJ54_9DINO
MVAPHKKRKDLGVSEAVVAKWNEGPDAKNLMAQVLAKVNFDRESFLRSIETLVRRERTTELIIDEAWYSEYEMEHDLKWSKYFG